MKSRDLRNIITTTKSIIPGIVIVIIITTMALCLSMSYAIPVMLIALLLGISTGFLHRKTSCKVGIEFSASKILRLGVALIGLRIAFSDLVALGWQTGFILLFAVVSTIGLGLLLSRFFGLSRQFGILSGGATGICGASAALALSSVLPDNKNKESDTLLTIIGATLLSTIAMIVYPMVAMYLNLSYMESSIFLGGSIHDVAQVVGAGYSVSSQVGDMAVITKLVRVALLVPVVLTILYITSLNNKNSSYKTATIFPFFLSAFIVLMILNSVFNMPPIITETATTISKYALIAAITAIGMKTNLKQLLSISYKPMLIMILEALWIAGIFLVYFLV